MKYAFIIYKYGNVFHIVIEIKNTHTYSLLKAILFGYMKCKSLFIIHNKNKVNHKDKYKELTNIWISSNPDFTFKIENVKCKKLICMYSASVCILIYLHFLKNMCNSRQNWGGEP